MATLKDIKRQIRAVGKTQKITRAMNMVAASRLRGAQEKMEGFRPYSSKLAEVLASLAERIGHAGSELVHPLMAPRAEVKKIDVVLMTSDRGLCASFNANLITKAERLISEKTAVGIECRLFCVGRKGRDYFRRIKVPIVGEHIGVVGSRFGFPAATAIGNDMIKRFLAGESDEVHIIYAAFQSMGKQPPVSSQLLPISSVGSSREELTGQGASESWAADYIYEPSAEQLMASLLPMHVNVQVYRALLETSTSEHAARMAAMDNATSACKEMVSNLTLAYNKARQAAITAQLMDIVGGAEALNTSL